MSREEGGRGTSSEDDLRDRDRKIRVLHLPEAIGGNSPGLAAAERSVGLDSQALTLRPHPFGYGGVRTMCNAGLSPLKLVAGMLKLFGLALSRSDVLHFNFGRTVLDPGPNFVAKFPRWTGVPLLLCWVQCGELWLYRRLGKTIFVTYMGDDARQGDVSREMFAITMADHVGPDYYTAASDRCKRQRIRTFDRFADEIIFLNPDLGWVLPRRAKFVSYASVDLQKWLPVYPRPESTPHIVHAPSHRGAKGSEWVLEAIDKLRAEGCDFRFTIVEGMPWQEAAEIYRQADLVVDQLLAGWYGGLAVECMALGKPVVAYLRQEDLHFLQREMREELPLILAQPDTIYEVLREWIQSPAERFEAQGKKGRRFVERWHDPLKIAADLSDSYRQALGDRNVKHR